MYFLKKSSIGDILKTREPGDLFYSGMHVLEHYKEYEIFLTKDSLEQFFSQEKLNKDCVKQLKAELDKHKASIRAFHCPASLFLTSCDQEGGTSTNYLSLDEVLCKSVHQNESLGLLKKTILLAAEFSEKKCPVIVVLHAGSINGCRDSFCLPEYDDAALQMLAAELDALSIGNPVRIALENVTPYVDPRSSLPAGQNTGWGASFWESLSVLKELNKKLTTDISFGVCVDFCHLIADNHIMAHGEKCCESIREFMKELTARLTDLNENVDQKQRITILLFHVSMLGEDGSHGRLFRYHDTDDRALLETIRTACAAYPDIPITLEMADGMDIDKACLNFDQMMYTLSAMHKDGVFGRMLDDNKCCELKDFFEHLFMLYAVPWSNMNKIQKLIYQVKEYILRNSPKTDANDSNAIGGLAAVFGFTFDEDKENTALLRLKAYIVYTRFCNLGKYLAEVYEKADFLSDNVEDFLLTMKYFMFCDDEIRQCIYTGVGFTFNIDLLPRTEQIFRFYDGIEETRIQAFKPQEEKEHYQGQNAPHCFSLMVEGIREQINGSADYKLLSCGKNFYPCLMKYYQEPMPGQFTLRIYKDTPVNYVEVNGKTLSVPAFLLKYCYMEKQYPQELHFTIDISVFRNDRGTRETISDTGTLAGFIKRIGSSGAEIVYEKVGSITDGEIVATRLPEEYNEYTLDMHQALGLVQACKEFRKRTEPISRILITDENKLTVTVDDTRKLEDIRNILACVTLSGSETTEDYNSLYKSIDNTKQYLPDLYRRWEVRIRGDA